MVSPFGNLEPFQFDEICELTALSFCNGTSSELAIRVDFIGESLQIGAVGVFKNGIHWISREDGRFKTTANELPTLLENGTIVYNKSNISVFMNMVQNFTEIFVVDDAITILHHYGSK